MTVTAIKNLSKKVNHGKNYHVTPRDGGWQVIGAGNQKPTKLFDTQYKAIDYGRRMAINQGSELVIHGENGRIREKNSYGNDPYPPRG